MNQKMLIVRTYKNNDFEKNTLLWRLWAQIRPSRKTEIYWDKNTGQQCLQTLTGAEGRRSSSSPCSTYTKGYTFLFYFDHKKEWKVEKRDLIDIKYKVLEGAIKN